MGTDIGDKTEAVRLLAKLLRENETVVFFPMRAWSPELAAWWKKYKIDHPSYQPGDIE